MSGHLTRHETPQTLPDGWDALAGCHWQTRAFLSYTHATHHCAQRYYTWHIGNKLRAGAVVYTLPIDVLTYFPVRLPVSWAPSIAVCGIPASVSASGLVGDAPHAARLLEEVRLVERGLFLALNLPPGFPVPAAMAAGDTLPTVVMDVAWKSLEEYAASLRSDYRRRFFRIRSAFSGVERATTACDAFTQAHYDGYRAVLAESEAKLETLPLPFFVNLPAPAFELTSIFREGRLLGWFILLEQDGRAAFFMGGMPPRAQRQENLYFYITTCVLERAIARNARFLDFGQTAEVPKLRLGGRLEPRRMAASHPNAVLRALLHAFAPLLSYRREVEEHRVFVQDVPTKDSAP